MLREMTRQGPRLHRRRDADGRVAGIFTDGDLRRLIETGADLRALRASEVMQRSARSSSAPTRSRSRRPT